MNINKSYIQLLNEIKSQVTNARIKAIRNVNKELITLYWSIGNLIVERQEQYGWGKSIVEQLSKDLRRELPDSKGFSAQNLWYMRQLYVEYKDFEFLQQVVGELPWGHNLLILSKVKDLKKELKSYKTVVTENKPV